MIHIKPSTTADTRSCDYTKVTKEQLYNSSTQHREDIAKGFEFFADMMVEQAWQHDWDKLQDIDGFHHDFLTGFKETTWWDNHRKVNRHHLLADDGVPKDVNLVDVLDMIIDCVMAGMGRTGDVYPLEISPDVLMNAFNNTVTLLKEQIIVDEDIKNYVKK